MSDKKEIINDEELENVSGGVSNCDKKSCYSDEEFDTKDKVEFIASKNEEVEYWISGEKNFLKGKISELKKCQKNNGKWKDRYVIHEPNISIWLNRNQIKRK